MNAPTPEIENIVSFWLTTDRAAAESVWEQKNKIWFHGGEAVDLEIKKNFALLVDKASSGELAPWSKSAQGRLALILLLDQFRRNLFREQPAMVAHDRDALTLMLAGIDDGHLLQLHFFEQMFFLMPYQHSEELAIQDAGVAAFDALAERVRTAGAKETLVERFRLIADYARRHQVVIARFGRFPHRNAFLARKNTEDETEFLSKPGSSF